MRLLRSARNGPNQAEIADVRKESICLTLLEPQAKAPLLYSGDAQLAKKNSLDWKVSHWQCRVRVVTHLKQRSEPCLNFGFPSRKETNKTVHWSLIKRDSQIIWLDRFEVREGLRVAGALASRSY
jgi:hypothetical protein